MAIRNNIFFNCSDETSPEILQYNDIFFIPGSIAFYNNQCWIDSQIESDLVPLSDVTFNNFETCEQCEENNLSGVVLSGCSNSQLAIVTFSTLDVPLIGSIVNYDNSCWEVLSLTGATTNISPLLNSYDICDICEDFITEGPFYESALFVNCCGL